MIKICLLNAENVSEDNASALLGYIPEERRNCISAKKNTADRLGSLFGELLVRREIIRSFGVKNTDIRFEHGLHGKPLYIGSDNFHFSVSHTKSIIAAAFSDHPVGIDIESADRKAYNIAKRCCTADELAFLDVSDKKDREFIRIWTKKEAFSKLTGEGIGMDYRTFSVLSDNRITTFEHSGYFISAASEYLSEYEICICTAAEVSDHFGGRDDIFC